MTTMIMTRDEVEQVLGRVGSWPFEEQARLAEIAEIIEAQQRPVPSADVATRAAVAEGISQLERGDVATPEQLEAALLRFRR